MSKKRSLTVAELKSLFSAYFKISQIKQAEFLTRLERELGEKVPSVENPKVTAIKEKLLELMVDLLARRLKRNRRSVPLISSRDAVRLTHEMMDAIEEMSGEKIGAEIRKVIEGCIGSLIENILEMMCPMISSNEDVYNRNWKVATAISDLAEDRGVAPVELVGLEGVLDEVTRRTYTREEFVDLSRKIASAYTDVDKLNATYIKPLLDAFPLDEEMRHELEGEMRSNLIEQVEKTKGLISSWLEEETNRIYAAA